MLTALATLLAVGCVTPKISSSVAPRIESLSELSIQSLRNRDYGSTVQRIERIPSLPHSASMVSYLSDNLRLYARLDLPSSPMPVAGYPVVIFIHGWAGIKAAPSLDFYVGPDSSYGAMIGAYAAAGFAVLTPGLRGHGTVGGVPADGIEFMQAWDNGSYLSPVFYAIDVLNLLDSLPGVEQLNADQVHVSAHSQGGDVALIVLAVAGEGSKVETPVSAASIWSGTFAPRLTQLETYWPMQTSPQAFMSGDGTWTRTATGRDGSVNPYFVFGYPPDWIGTIEQDQWTWQNDAWSVPTVAGAVQVKLREMYSAINNYVDDMDAVSFAMNSDNWLTVLHDERVVEALDAIDPFDMEDLLTEPLILQHSDRDFYSLPAWNTELCHRINARGGTCFDFEYEGNTHSLQISEEEWFSDRHSHAGFDTALARDIALFRRQNPAEISFP